MRAVHGIYDLIEFYGRVMMAMMMVMGMTRDFHYGGLKIRMKWMIDKGNGEKFQLRASAQPRLGKSIRKGEDANEPDKLIIYISTSI